MAAISHVFTIRRAAQILGRDEDLLWELSDQLEPEDGKLWVYDIDALKPPPSPTMASRRFAKLSRIRSIAPVNLKTSVPRCSAYAYVEEQERREQIAKRDAVEHAEEPDVRPAFTHAAVVDEPQREQEQRPAQHAPMRGELALLLDQPRE